MDVEMPPAEPVARATAPRAVPAGAKPRAWCFTLNNRVDEWAVPIQAGDGGLRYCVFQHERGANGHLHIQGYAEFNKPVRMATAITVLGLHGAHLEARRGTRDQARDYCMKADSRVDGPWEWGDWGAGGQGKRNELADAAKLLKEGKPLHVVMDEHPTTFIRYHRGLREMQFELTRQKNTQQMRNLKVTVLIGDTGVGKTHSVYEWASAHETPLFKLDAANRVWWDGYTGEKVILIDDFYGWIKYGFLLNVLDKYPLRVEIKGGFIWANWTHVFITSNAHPNLWYKKGLTPALARRINKCYKVTGPDERTQIQLGEPIVAPIFDNEYYRTVPNARDEHYDD